MANPAREFREQNPDATVVKRERNSIHVQLPDGRTRALIASGPIHTESGEEISTAWQAGVAPWQFQMLRADYNAFALSDFSNGQIVRYVDPASGADIRFQPAQLQWTNSIDQVEAIADVASVQAQVTDDVLRWEGSFGTGRDFEWVASTDRLSKRLILASAPPDPPQFIIDGGQPVMRLQFIFALASGVEAHIDGALWDRRTTESTRAVVEFRSTATGDVLWQMQPATVEDANGETVTCVTRFRRAGNSLFVEVRVPYEWLQAAAYPVQIDPTLTLQPDAAAGKDTYLYSGAAFEDRNYGVNTSFDAIMDGNGVTRRALVEFDISSIPSGSAVSSATFTFTGRGGTTTDELSVHRITQAWLEGTGSGTATGDGATWKTYDGVSAWATAGGDFDATADATYIPPNTLDGTKHDIVITDLVQEWVDGTANNGLLLKVTSEVGVNKGLTGRSSDYATATDRPKLVVEYSELVTVNAAPIEVAVTIPTATVSVPNVIAAQPLQIAVIIPQVTVAIAPLIQAQPITIAVTIPQVTVTGGVAFGDTVLADKAVYTVVLSDRNQPTG